MELVQSLEAAVGEIPHFSWFPVFFAARVQMVFGLRLLWMVIERDPNPARIYRCIDVPCVRACPWYLPSPPTAHLPEYEVEVEMNEE